MLPREGRKPPRGGPGAAGYDRPLHKNGSGTPACRHTMAQKTTGKWMRRLLILGVLGAAVGALLWWAGRPTPVAVQMVEVSRGAVDATVSNTRAGTVEACRRTRLSMIGGGRIERLHVKEGDRVAAGQELMRLWQGDLDAELALAKAQRETAARRQHEVCEVAATAEREAQRQQALADQGFVSTARLDTVRSEAQARAASCQTAQADVAQATARITVVTTARERGVLVAPFAGTVARIVGEVGEYSTPSPPGVATPPAVDLIDESCLYVKAPMDEVDAPKLSVGQAVRISLDALPGRSFPGQVQRIAPYVSALERQARTVEIEARFDRPEEVGRLLVGYSADVEVLLSTRSQVLRLPTAALKEGNRVLVLGADDRLVEKTVQTGLSNWEHTEIVAGLAEGEAVVSSLERAGVKPGALARRESAADAADRR